VPWTASTFRAAKPEFSDATDPQVETALADAGAYCNADVFGDQHDQAVGLYAAHLLAISPFGQNARLVNKQGDTTYRTQWRRLARVCTPSPQTVGQDP